MELISPASPLIAQEGEKRELNLGRAKEMSLTPHQCYGYGLCS